MKPNEYIIYEDYAEIICLNIKKEISGKLLIDLEDVDKCKKYRWFIKEDKYGVSDTLSKRVRIHNIIMNNQGDKVVDHINRNGLDNRKNNLRLTDQAMNNKNIGLGKNNTTGIIGVSVCKSSKKIKWFAELMCDRVKVLRECFASKEDAIKARLEAEHKYFGEFAPQKHLFKKYGVDSQ